MTSSLNCLKSNLERHKTVFKNIFEKMNQLEHYEMMMRPVTKEGESCVSTEES